jgi:hypothetical protein
MTTPYTNNNISTLRPSYLDNAANLPYNFSDTPVVGDLSNIIYQDGTFQSIKGEAWKNFSETIKAAIPPKGNLNNPIGYQEEVTDSFLVTHMQEFFYIYQPFVTNSVYNQTKKSLTDENVTTSNADYYTGLFKENFTAWMSYRRNDSNGNDVLAKDFTEFLNSKTEMQFRQRNVIMWQLSRVIGMISLLNDRTINTGHRSVTWNNTATLALEAMNRIDVPAVTASSEDVSVPDPDSIQSQHNSMMDLERARANFKRANEKSQNEEATLSYSSDASAQQRTSLDSFWSSLSTIINNLSN